MIRGAISACRSPTAAQGRGRIVALIGRSRRDQDGHVAGGEHRLLSGWEVLARLLVWDVFSDIAIPLSSGQVSSYLWADKSDEILRGNTRDLDLADRVAGGEPAVVKT
jgi:hypothetical protein